MRFSDLVSIIWKNMWKRRTRTIFTMMGVIIGCLAVFIIVSITNGFDKYLNDQMSGLMDTSVITINPYWGMEEDSSSGNKDEVKPKTKLDDKCVKELESLYFITEVLPKKYANGTIKLGKDKQGWARVLAADVYDPNSLELLIGRFPRPNSKEIILGYDVAKELLGYGWDQQITDPSELEVLVGKQVKIGNEYGGMDENGDMIQGKMLSSKIVGVLTNTGNQNNYMIQSPTKFVDQLIKETSIGYPKEEIEKLLTNYDEIAVRVDDKSKLEEYEDTLKAMGYSTYSFKEFEDSSKNMLMGVSLILGSLAGISLLVASFGITNTMDMAIYERNKEIGVMKVIGGSLNDIRKIFVGEACAISLTGGIISIILGLIINLGINSVAQTLTQSTLGQPIDKIAIPSVTLILGIMAFCIFIGFISGILPANKAAKTDVITAIR